MWTAALMAALAWQLTFASSARAVDPDVGCQASLLKAAGKYASCRLSADSKAAKTATTADYNKCEEKFYKSWEKARDKGLDACSEHRQGGSWQWFQAAITDATTRVGESLAIAGAPTDGNLPYCKLPATGQTTSYVSGDDGDVEAGSKLGFVMVGSVWRGTATYDALSPGFQAILDQRTGLIWEKKNDAGGLRDVDNTACWDPAACPGASIWDHVNKLNSTCWVDDSVSCSVDDDCATTGTPVCGYAGFRDWRVPNIKELMSIVDYSVPHPGPAVPNAFYDACSSGCLDCSCIGGWELGAYWSSTTAAIYSTTEAWTVHFSDGFVISGLLDGTHKDDALHIRAVRAGL